MASLKTISLPHGTIPTQMFGNVNLQNAVMYVNENFAAVKDGVNDAVSATNDALDEKAASDHDHDDAYAALEHAHGMDDVTGLNAALDGKAELNHEHSQYLSSLPAHYHDVSGIQGLGEQLQAKADKTHAHTIAQVENLSTELGVKASTAYVDQQVNSVGQTIKTIADQEIEDCRSYKSNKQDASQQSPDVPKDVVLEVAPDGETPAQRIARKNAQVGQSQRFARADHKHVFSPSLGENPTDNRTQPVEDFDNPPEQHEPSFSAWEADGTKGLKIRLYSLVTGERYDRYFTPVDLEISSCGNIVKATVVSGETISIGA